MLIPSMGSIWMATARAMMFRRLLRSVELAAHGCELGGDTLPRRRALRKVHGVGEADLGRAQVLDLALDHPGLGPQRRLGGGDHQTAFQPEPAPRRDLCL